MKSTVCSCFHDFPAMMARVHEHLRPGGHAEFLDFAFELVGADDEAEARYQGSSLARFVRCCVAGGAARGKDFRSGRRLRGWMAAAGFGGVAERQFLVPLSAWPLDPADRVVGSWSSLDWIKFLGGSTKLLEAAGMPLGEIPGFLEEVEHDVLDRNMRVYWISESFHFISFFLFFFPFFPLFVSLFLSSPRWRWTWDGDGWIDHD